jgi:hypothetical protein
MRPLFSILSFASLALCLLTGVMLPRSFRAEDRVLLSLPWIPENQSRQRIRIQADTERGRISVGANVCSERSLSFPLENITGGWFILQERNTITWKDVFCGFETGHDSARPRTHFLVVPLWPIFLVTAILPLLKVRCSLKARRASSAGFCDSCGYDLRATPERCPECGRICQGPAHHGGSYPLPPQG